MAFKTTMNVLIVGATPPLAAVWRSHLERQGASVRQSTDADDAIGQISEWTFDVIVLDLDLTSGSVIAVADFAQYRQPATNVIFVTATTFFSDGSIFNLSANARALVPSDTRPEDLAAMVEHYGTRPAPPT